MSISIAAPYRGGLATPSFLYRPETRGFALGLIASVIWGSYLALSRAGVSSGLHATDIAALRFGVAGIIMLPWLLRHTASTARDISMTRALALSAVAGPLFIVIGVGGYMFAPLAHGAVVQPAAVTLGSIGLAYFLLGDRPTSSRVIGIGIILCGLAIIAGPSLLASGASTAIGDLLFMSAGLMWALFAVFSKRWGVSPVAGTAVVSVLSAVVFVPFYVLVIGPERLLAISWQMLAAQVVVQGVLSGVVAVIAFSAAVRTLGVGRASVFPAMVPAFAIAIGAPITGELPTTLQFGGLAIVTVGLLAAIGVLTLPRKSMA